MVVQNHPSGDPKPSRDDIEMTKEIHKAAEALGEGMLGRAARERSRVTTSPYFTRLGSRA